MKESDIIERINTLCADREWTYYRLAKESGITYSTLCTMLHKATAPSFSTLSRICNGFGITLSQFFDFSDPHPSLSPEQRAHLTEWNRLSSSNKKHLEAYMNFLLHEQKNEPT